MIMIIVVRVGEEVMTDGVMEVVRILRYELFTGKICREEFEIHKSKTKIIFRRKT